MDEMIATLKSVLKVIKIQFFLFDVQKIKKREDFKIIHQENFSSHI